MTCTVTIGIPFLNARRYLADAVRSVFAQAFTDWELLLIDDGSTDSSLDVVRNLHDRCVRIVSDGTNRGLCARLNQMYRLHRGPTSHAWTPTISCIRNASNGRSRICNRSRNSMSSTRRRTSSTTI
jgi:hypothetical protein